MGLIEDRKQWGLPYLVNPLILRDPFLELLLGLILADRLVLWRRPSNLGYVLGDQLAVIADRLDEHDLRPMQVRAHGVVEPLKGSTRLASSSVTFSQHPKHPRA